MKAAAPSPLGKSPRGPVTLIGLYLQSLGVRHLKGTCTRPNVNSHNIDYGTSYLFLQIAYRRTLYWSV